MLHIYADLVVPYSQVTANAGEIKGFQNLEINWQQWNPFVNVGYSQNVVVTISFYSITR